MRLRAIVYIACIAATLLGGLLLIGGWTYSNYVTISKQAAKNLFYRVKGPGLGSAWCAPAHFLLDLEVPQSITQNATGVITLTVTPTSAVQIACPISVELLAPAFNVTPIWDTVVGVKYSATVNPGQAYVGRWLLTPKHMGTYIVAAVVNTCFVRKGVSVLNTFGLQEQQAQALTGAGNVIGFLLVTPLAVPIFNLVSVPARRRRSRVKPTASHQKAPASSPPAPPSFAASLPKADGNARVLAGIGCALPPFGLLTFLFPAKNDGYVRFYGTQATLIGIGAAVMTIGWIRLGANWTTYLVCGGLAILYLCGIFFGFSGRKYKLPMIGQIAEWSVTGGPRASILWLAKSLDDLKQTVWKFLSQKINAERFAIVALACSLALILILISNGTRLQAANARLRTANAALATANGELGNVVHVDVTNLNDNGPGSLRDALARVEQSGVITFDPRLNGTITLTSGPLAVTRSVNIAAGSSQHIIVSGGNKSRVFEIMPPNLAATVPPPGSTVGPVVSISNLTISDGYAGEDPYNTDGGGVLNLYSTVTLTKDIISGNTAPFKGGGIYNKGTLQVLNCQITSNRAVTGDGGGLYTDSRWTMFISNTTISGNQAGAEGGGIAQFIFASPDNGWTSLINGSQVFGNTAQIHGGGIYGDGGTGSVTWSSNSSVQNNSPDNTVCDHSAC
jgi:uncharacterized membrane protein